MTPLIRSASLTHFAELAGRCGLDAAALVRDAGLPRRCLHEPDLRVRADQVARVLELAAERGREPAFGLRLALSRRLSNLGPLGLLVRDQPTLRGALEALVQHVHLHNEALTVQLEQVSSLVVIRVELHGAPPQSLRQATELAIGALYRMLVLMLGAPWRPRLVCFRHAAPPLLAVHRQLFGDAVEFGHEFDGVVCNATDLDAENPGADPVLARYAGRLLRPGRARARTWAARVRECALVLLPRGHCSVEAVAQHLGVDRRTVARHLGREGTSYTALVDGMRLELLARYDEGTRPLAEVAQLLGFAAPASFSRWHRAHLGTSARAARSTRAGAATRARSASKA